jgi:hypothetical protein
MKKLMAFLMVATVLCTGAMAVSAAEGDLVESPTGGSGAGVVTTTGADTTTGTETTTTTVTTAAETKAETVQTGDAAPLAIVGTLALLGLTGAGIAVGKRKREE